MSSVVGIDLSTKALDLVKLDETTNRAEWVRCELHGKTAWERTLSVRWGIVIDPASPFGGNWWSDVYLVAIEQPMGRGKVGSTSVLNRVVGAVATSLPAHLRDPAQCWLIPPHEWKAGLRLKSKPTFDDIDRFAGTIDRQTGEIANDANARDAYCLAMYARDLNAKGLAAA